MAKTILSGAADANGDTPPPPAELRSILASSTQSKQLFFTPSGGSRYIALNTTKPPFDNLDVRKAVAYVLDRNAMRLTRGGDGRRRDRDALHRPELRRRGLQPVGRVELRPVPELRRLRRRGQGQAADGAGRLRERDVHRARGEHGGRQHAARLRHGQGGRGRPGQDRDQDPPRVGHPRDHVHEVLRRARRTSRTSARTSGGCPTSTSRRRSST